MTAQLYGLRDEQVVAVAKQHFDHWHVHPVVKMSKSRREAVPTKVATREAAEQALRDLGAERIIAIRVRLTAIWPGLTPQPALWHP